LVLSAILFVIGVIGVLINRNAIVIFMSIEIMLNAVNLSLIAFSQFMGSPAGQVMVFLVMAVAAAEAVVGLAIIVVIHRSRESINVDDVNLMKW
jgi:NADH-quinone oxidoreductase subunit K